MLEAMVTGVDDPDELAEMAKGRLRNKRPELRHALRGLTGPHQRMMIQSQLRHIDFLDQQIDQLSEEVSKRMRPFEQAVSRLDDIPGIGPRNVQEILAEIGLDMSKFPTADHLSSWSKVSPGNNESAGKRKSGRTGHANPWLRSALIEAAWAAVRKKGTYLSAQYHRIAARRGKKRAIVAVAHSILVIIYHMLRDGSTYRELGGEYFDQRNRQTTIRRSVQRIQRLGYKVTLEAA